MEPVRGTTYDPAADARNDRLADAASVDVVEEARVAEAARTSTHMAREWIERARALLDTAASGGRDH
ncbi:hypothetical protein [Salinigranum marinum]|uniref:hypothetical protein n=1 Tax=Salinigranum marinum TaxID=1515595 RepID=UPI002989EA38|nr:hypothetical protein [Salinigranum marinum]